MTQQSSQPWVWVCGRPAQSSISIATLRPSTYPRPAPHWKEGMLVPTSQP